MKTLNCQKYIAMRRVYVKGVFIPFLLPTHKTLFDVCTTCKLWRADLSDLSRGSEHVSDLGLSTLRASVLAGWRARSSATPGTTGLSALKYDNPFPSIFAPKHK